ncbi:type I restriction endonuclease subunit R [Emticicia sp. 17c]|uniref:type I restriction endonuclease subunit R n=1 Tax=Emticicia sp. 17c TaxID=3127704 RepID=UPI00301D3E1A
MTQSELELEKKLIEALVKIGYQFVTIKDENALIANLKQQLEKHNHVQLTDREFTQVLNHLNKGNIWDRAKILRDRMHLTKEDGTSVYLQFMNMDFWCQNEYQVTNQITIEGSYKNRYDVTILINGLPLAQIELKRRGLELKEAFNQTNRYQRHSYSANHGLFQYVQLFVISNGVNTKYYSNNARQSFKQTFYWSDKSNKLITDLFAFTDAFLEKCHLSKMIARYIVLSEKNNTLMVLRPYQYYAVEAIVERVRTNPKNGYIWHTTGSGKTLTSFKASQILTNIPGIHKVVFVVDRKDLDYQTTKEFNSFSEGSVDGTDNTQKLVGQFADDTKLIVTTIQKLNTAISKQKYLSRMEKLKDKKIVFIFDECHRTQFGETHKRIKKFFTNNQMFGFTGTPIFEKNALSVAGRKRTTKELFDERLHQYVITDAIKDDNVLKFSVEYVGRYKQKNSENEIDIDVEGIDTKELVESPQRIDKIADYIIAHHSRKTHNKAFTAMFCVSSIDTLTKYYENFAQKKLEGKHNLSIATIFSFRANEDDKDANGLLEVDILDDNAPINSHSRDKLESYIADYNKMFGTNHSTKDSQAFYNYYNEISMRVRKKEIDVLLVVNMFLTGFDSPLLNTLYVDKNLQYHGLVQAFSRTNRILDEKKSHGNIVCFRNLKKATDDAIALFSDKNAKEDIILKPYVDYVAKFNAVYAELLAIVPTIDSVNDLPTEVEQFAFIQKFRELIRIKNVLNTFADFKDEDLQIPPQDFEDYQSKYLDLHDQVKSNTQKEKVSILDDVDFELELIHRDEINVAYILRLLSNYKQATQAEQDKKRKEITELLETQIQLRSKRQLIEKFINENFPYIEDSDAIEAEFDAFWNIETDKALNTLSEEESLDSNKLKEAINEFLFSQRLPMTKEIDNMLIVKPKLLQRTTVFTRIKDKIKAFIETFVEGV